MSCPPTPAIDLDNRPEPKAIMFKNHRDRTIKRMKAAGADGAILIYGLPEPGRPLCDFEPAFRNESCFYWLTGVNEADCAIYIDLATGKNVLFYPDLPAELAIWMGPLPKNDDVKTRYGMDEVRLTPTIADFLAQVKPKTIYTLEPTFLLKDPKFPVDYKVALEAIGEERQIKDDDELELIRYACNVNCDAFRHVFKQVKPGMYAQQVEGILQHKYIDAYCRLNAFATIVCSGTVCATLHHHANSRKLEENDLVLIDAGCEYNCYASDNTRTIPASGKFTEDQKAVYQAVLNSQNAVIKAAAPGVPWPAMAKLAAITMAEGLLKAGLFQNGTPAEIVESGAMEVFFPHGLGHGMGLDCHEIAGWEPGHQRPQEYHIRCLRMGRTLEKGIVVTVEPGCYFVPELYEVAFTKPEVAKYINKEVCLRFRKTVGGIRIEDDILITENGNVNLSTIPKEINEIEAMMAH